MKDEPFVGREVVLEESLGEDAVAERRERERVRDAHQEGDAGVALARVRARPCQRESEHAPPGSTVAE